jgi:beta-1,4-mannosyl-glycoprotein beta-1,4-N-acetylglucosaminyltransferase|tara:strand:+ start:1364 stop:2254 length:891 start_codon:yes stop_codon:yes gene_type:complete
MKIYDTFLFGYELDLLEIRLNILDPYVDYFVFSESPWAFSGINKGLNYENNKDKFKKFKHKIIYNRIPDPTEEQLRKINQKYGVEGYPTYQRDVYQKDSIKSVLEEYCNDDDIILWSDLDEVPNPNVLKDLKSFYQSGCVYNFAQDNYQASLNWFETTGTILSQTPDFEYGSEGPRWVGTKMCDYATLKKYTMTDLRRPLSQESNHRIYPGGWHWSTVGSNQIGTMEERIMMKMKTSAHREVFDNPDLINIISDQISKNLSPIGQANARYRTVEFNEDNYPQYLIDNKEKYSYLIK